MSGSPRVENSTKRRHANTSSDTGRPKAKRSKFTLEEARIPSTNNHGDVFVIGAGDFGQLGLGSNILEKSRPALICMDHEIVDICAGGMHTVCLTSEGRVLTFGCNDEGALGRITDEQAEFIPDFADLPGKVKQISAGGSHTAALLENGQVYAWGTFRDSHGSMGLTPRGNERLPYLIMSDHVIMKIASGADHLVFLTNRRQVLTCGCPEQGQLGRTTERGSSRYVRNGIRKGQMAKLLTPFQLSLKPSLRLHFDDIWAGTYATFAKVAGKDDIYVCGLNNYSQLGLKSRNTQFIPKLSEEFSKYKWNLIACSVHHNILLDVDGKTYAIGRKEYGRLGLGENCEDASELVEIPALQGKKVVNVAAGLSSSFAITKDGDLYGQGMGTVGQFKEDCYTPTLIKNKVYRVSSGGQHTVILALTDNDDQDSDSE